MIGKCGAFLDGPQSADYRPAPRKRSRPTGKASRNRWVCAPHKWSDGTATSPRESVSVRTSITEQSTCHRNASLAPFRIVQHDGRLRLDVSRLPRTSAVTVRSVSTAITWPRSSCSRKPHSRLNRTSGLPSPSRSISVPTPPADVLPTYRLPETRPTGNESRPCLRSSGEPSRGWVACAGGIDEGAVRASRGYDAHRPKVPVVLRSEGSRISSGAGEAIARKFCRYSAGRVSGARDVRALGVSQRPAIVREKRPGYAPIHRIRRSLPYYRQHSVRCQRQLVAERGPPSFLRPVIDRAPHQQRCTNSTLHTPSYPAGRLAAVANGRSRGTSEQS